MNIKDIKVGDKVRLRSDVFSPELTEIYESHCITKDAVIRLLSLGEVTVRSVGPAVEDAPNDWDSIQVFEMGYFWPVELFEPAGNSNKTKEETVQEDIRRVEEIIQRYNLSDISGPAVSLIDWLKENGLEELEKEQKKA